ncbi:MAG: hypothetical protein BWY52_00470 [Chloroflexi bacterium ADurb.Bin325]|nr:MAG: hypothetical protein BWY52_00470 [Chloroflexi bacterium ADurb.Bin325]
MKLAEALILRADCNRRLEQLNQRLLRSAKVQEGDKPAEDPQEMLAELEQVTGQLQQLIQRINRTNSSTLLDESDTLSDALAVRDVLRLKQEVYQDLAQAAIVTQNRYSKSEVKFFSAVDVASIQRRADDLARQHRDLDTRIQEANWRTELLE